MANIQQKSDHISKQRQAIRNFIAALDELARLKREYDAQNFNHASAGILDADMVGANADITAQTFKNAVNGAQEFNTAFTAGATITATTDKKLYLII
jgi:hypothetical protein